MKRDFKITFIWECILAFIIGIGVVNFGPIQIARINGNSMYPTINDGSLLFGLRWFQTYGYGDIVITDDLEELEIEGEAGFSITKRIIGLEGDTISFKDGILYRNGEKVEEPYANLDDYTSSENVVVPEDCVFLAGDNRYNSLDSRNFGCIELNEIQSKYLYRIGK